MNDPEKMLTKAEIRYLENTTCKDCVSFCRPSSYLPTTKYDAVGWCPEIEAFVSANDTLYETECDAFLGRDVR